MNRLVSKVERVADSFWAKVKKHVDDDACWMWQGSKLHPNRCGQVYGQFPVAEPGRKPISYRAHRFAWVLTNGAIPDGMVIMHKCDVPLCVNPRHLRMGTQAENVADQYAKGRGTYGEKHGRAKLNAIAVRQIRASVDTDANLAKRFGVHVTTIKKARDGTFWGTVN